MPFLGGLLILISMKTLQLYHISMLFVDLEYVPRIITNDVIMAFKPLYMVLKKRMRLKKLGIEPTCLATRKIYIKTQTQSICCI